MPESDQPSYRFDRPNDLSEPAGLVAPAPVPTGQQAPPPMPTLEQDRQVLAWLQCSPVLGGEVTGYICDALLDWSLNGGRSFPDMALPAGGPDVDHLQALEEIIERIGQRIGDAPTVAEKLELGRAGRLLRRAVWAWSDPQAVRESIDRELMMTRPGLLEFPAAPVRPAGWLR